MINSPPSLNRHLARIVFTTFLFTFIVSRILVILIMARKVPDFYLHMGGTHVHHLNYGIFLLSAVGAVLLFVPLGDKGKKWSAFVYGFGLALTFDEFGMWLHLGGSYWQRGSFDAVVVVLSLLGVIAFAPRPGRLKTHHYLTGIAVIFAVVSFYVLLFKSFNLVGRKVGPKIHEIEQRGPQ